ncbi:MULTISPECIES: WG repeat-containing protein [Niastella]|uniref:WG repeat-containing protein n=1 Tax=Niastella soli TaxID=2821487 RepID=A0ABS3YZM3_9BACT|nr:WG repeat-containing protein [Niastella soli]MBO9203378.1 WG repeat-containing protein [Niastella soli]
MKHLLIIILTLFFTACKTTQLAIIKQNGKFGCIDKKGNLVIKPEWDWMLQGDKNKQILVEKDSLFGFVDNHGNVLIEPKYKSAMVFYDGFASVSNGNKFGFINIKGDTVIPFVFDDVFLGFSNGLSDVRVNDSCGYIDKSGKVVIPLIYKTSYPFLSDVASVETFDGQTLLIDKKGNTFAYNKDRYKYKRLWALNSYPGSFTTQTGQGRINKAGDTIVPPIYDVTGNLSDHMYIVELKGKWGAYNDKGKLIVEPKFDEIWHYNEGYANFKLNGKWGYVDKKGRIVIEPTFDYASQFENGLAYVEFNGKSGFVDKKGKFAIKPEFEINKDSEFQ